MSRSLTIGLVVLCAAGLIGWWALRPAQAEPPRRIPVGRVHGLAALNGSVWAANFAGRTVDRIDAKSERVAARVDVGATPTNPTAAFGSVWVPVLGRQVLVRVRGDRVVSRIPGLFQDAVAGGGMLWATTWENAPAAPGSWRGRSLAKIDPATNRVLKTFRLEGIPLGLAAGFGSVWATNFSGTELFRIAERSNTVSKIPLRARSFGIATTRNSVWVAVQGGRILRIDPQTNRVVSEVTLGQYIDYLTVSGDDVWAAAFDDALRTTIFRIDGQSGKVKTRFAAGTASQGLAIADGKLFAGDYEGAAVWRYAI